MVAAVHDEEDNGFDFGAFSKATSGQVGHAYRSEHHRYRGSRRSYQALLCLHIFATATSAQTVSDMLQHHRQSQHYSSPAG